MLIRRYTRLLENAASLPQATTRTEKSEEGKLLTSGAKVHVPAGEP